MWWGALLCAGFLLVVLWAIRSRQDLGQVPPSPTAVPGPEEGIQSGSVGLDPGSSVDRTSGGLGESGVLLVKVRSKEGAPIDRAEVGVRPVDSGASEGWVSSALVEHLGATTNGSMAVIAAAVAGKIIVVRAEGYQAFEAACPDPADQGVLDVVLESAISVRVSCRLRSGLPVGEVELALSQSPLAEARLAAPRFGERQAITPQAMAVHSRVSSADGTAEFSALAPGTYYVQATSQGHLLVGGLDRGNLIDVASARTVHLVFDPVFVAFFAVTNDQVLGYSARYPQSLRTSPELLPRAWGLSERLREIGGGGCFVMGVPSFADSQYAMLPDAIEVQLYTELRGCVTIAVPLVSYALCTAPHTIPIDTPERAVQPVAVSFALTTPAGREVAVPGLRVSPSDGECSNVSVVWDSARLPLLPGEYRLRTSQPFLAGVLSGKPVVVDGSPLIGFPVQQEYVHCRLHGRYPTGRTVEAGEVIFTSGQTQYRFVASRGLSEYLFVVPIGTMSVALVAHGGGRVECELVVAMADQPVSHDLGTVR